MKRFLICALLSFASLMNAAFAQIPAKIITLPSALTNISVGELKIGVLHTLLDEHTPHPKRYITFFSPNAKGAGSAIGFEMKPLEFTPSLTLQTGADCRLSGIRILQRGDNLQVVFAERPGMWAESKVYTFAIYELVKTKDAEMPYPDLYFKQVKKLQTKASYCDANNALDKESQLFL